MDEKTQSIPVNNKPAWVQLYEARRVQVEIQSRHAGRPPAIVPRHKVGLTLSQGEIHELEEWQTRFSRMLERKVSTGETIGILTRMCTSRYERLFSKSNAPDENLKNLVEKMIGD
jgi:hypothetical protein